MSVNHREPKPEVKRVDASAPGFQGSPDPRFHGVKFDVPARVYHNDANGSDMTLQRLYSTGPLKAEFTGATCGNCVNFYPDQKIGTRQMGRCKARGFLRVHEDTPADERRKGWRDPVSQMVFRFWPSCPLFSKRERLSRR